MFSCACTGDVPPLTRHIARSLALLLGSGGFAMPRRDVLLTCELVPIERLKGMSREQLNRWLEAWYNVDGGESPHYVPYHRWWPGRAGTGQVANELALLIDAAVPTDASP
jgi:long-chain-fatty-acid--[acyl-carrier-protein] ligase